MSNEEKVVCVTGGSGYIASWIIKLLLHRGYSVKASVRNLRDVMKTRHLISLEGAQKRLHLFEANLLEEWSFDPLVHGCECVFHTASPVLHSREVVDPQEQLMDPALKGTLNVLRSCVKSNSVKRVVLTSSMATVMCSAKAQASGEDIVVDETWFSDPDFCKELKEWYLVSKIISEEAASKFATEKGIDLVTINPGLVIGPLLQPTINVSVHMILKLINGSSKTYPNLIYRCVDVRDVALAHILAYEVPSTNGRYCLVGHCQHYAQVIDIVRKLYPSLPVAERSDENELVQTHGVSKEKAKALGIEFIPLEITLRDTVESLKEKSFLKIY